MRAALVVLFALPMMATTHREVLLVPVPQQRIILVARGDQRTIEARDDRFGMVVWSTGGVAAPRVHAVSEDGDWAAIADPVANEVAIVSTRARNTQQFRVPETPVALTFLGTDLFVLSRDGEALTRIGMRASGAQPAGVRAAMESIPMRPDSTFLTRAGDRLYVYSRLEGAIDEIDPTGMMRTRSLRVPPHAGDMESDGRRGYLVYPRSGKMTTVSLAEMRNLGEVEVGAVPVDIALESDPNLISAGVVSVADPSSKRIWRVERSQSTAEAFGRGFLRGLLGLGLYTPRSTEFPTGIDRLWNAEGRRLAYDSSSGTLYRIAGGRSRILARVSSPWAFAAVGPRLAVWDEPRQTLEFRSLGD
jgi:hypothetical protein